MNNVTFLPGLPSPPPARIRVFPIDGEFVAFEDALGDATVYLTIGTSETRVSILDDEGVCLGRWAATFGWSFMFDLPISVNGSDVQFEHAETVARAISGKAKIFGHQVDTTAWVELAESKILNALGDILNRTIGAGERYSGIVLCAPKWMHGLLGSSRRLRPHILHEIRES